MVREVAQAHIARALNELRAKDLRTIQAETALVWCGRACAAARLGLVEDSVEYGHEAIEHAALSGDAELLAGVRSCMREHGVRV